MNIIRSLNPNKAHGWDEISIRMIKLSDVSFVNPLEIIFTNCLRQCVFPEIWKCADVVPVREGREQNAKSNYRPISQARRSRGAGGGPGGCSPHFFASSA